MVDSEKSVFVLENKRGVSVMIGYILLITFVIAIAAILYQWLSTYVPQEDIDCPGGVSLYVSDHFYDSSSGHLDLEIENNGRFNVSGFYVRYANRSSVSLATKDLSKHLITSSYSSQLIPGVSYKSDNANKFAPGQAHNFTFDVSSLNSVHSVEITPIRIQEVENKQSEVSCSGAGFEKTLNITL